MAEAKQPTTEPAEFKVPTYLRLSKIATYVLYAWTLLGTILLGLRVFLLAFSANATTPFVDFVYRTSADYLAPFRGIFPSKSIGETGYLDIAAIFAIIIYLLITWGFSALINYLQHKIDTEELDYKEKLSAQSKLAATKNISKK